MQLAFLFIEITIILVTLVSSKLSAAEAPTCAKTIEHYRIADTGAGGHSLESAATYCLVEDVFVKWNYS